MEEIKVADTGETVAFYAYQSSDHISPATGITGHVVDYFLRNGSRTSMTTPTVTEKDATNMPGWYTLEVDEAGMVSAAGVTSIDIKASGMDPVPIKVKIIGNTTKEVYDIIPSAADIVDEFETQSQADPTGFHVNVIEIGGTAQTPNDNSADINDILDDTSEIGTAGAGLTGLGDSRIANLDTTISSRLAPAGTLATVTNLTNAPTNGDLTATMKTSVNDQVVDVIRTDTTSEMSQGALPVDPTIEEMLSYQYFRLRNKRVVSETEDATYDDAGTTKLYKAPVEELNDVFTKSEYVSG